VSKRGHDTISRLPKTSIATSTRYPVMSPFWSATVRALQPYVPGEQPKLPNLVKLNTNENPYGPSPRVLEAIRGETADSLRLYPDPESSRLREAIAAFFGNIEPRQVFVGNGSDEVLAHAFLALLKHEQPILFPDITYSFYPVYCKLYGIAYRTVALDDNFALRVADYSQPNGGIIFPNPNAPTGRALPLADIEALLKANPASVVIVDEAYIDFGGESAVALVNRFPNLLVVQTFSKSRSLAGLRVGYAIGHDDLIDALQRVKNSFNSYPLDRLAIAGATAAIEDREWFERTRQAVIRTRTALTRDLESLGFEVLPSAANFVFVHHPQHDAEKSALALRQRGIIVRHFKAPRIEQFLRITVGTDEQCATLVKALREILSA
jgi:histidinol-phosphate aminotransferase